MMVKVNEFGCESKDVVIFEAVVSESTFEKLRQKYGNQFSYYRLSPFEIKVVWRFFYEQGL